MILEKRLTQIQEDLVHATEQLAKTNEELESKEKNVHAVSCLSDLMLKWLKTFYHFIDRLRMKLLHYLEKFNSWKKIWKSLKKVPKSLRLNLNKYHKLVMKVNGK